MGFCFRYWTKWSCGAWPRGCRLSRITRSARTQGMIPVHCEPLLLQAAEDALHPQRKAHQPHYVHCQLPGWQQGSFTAVPPPGYITFPWTILSATSKALPCRCTAKCLHPTRVAEGSPLPPTTREDPRRSFCQQLHCQVTKFSGMCTVPALCLGNWSSGYGFSVESNPVCQQAAGSLPNTETPGSCPAPFPKQKQHQAHGGFLPTSPPAQGWIRPLDEPCEAFLRLRQLFQQFPLTPRLQLSPRANPGGVSASRIQPSTGRKGFLALERQKGKGQTYLKCRSLKVKWVSTMPVVFTLVRSTSCWVGM